MPYSALSSMPTSDLLEMKRVITDILATRNATELKVGCFAEFQSNKRGVTRKVTIQVTRINRTSVSGTEVAPSASPGGNWRVSVSMLNVLPSAPIVAPASTPVTVPPVEPKLALPTPPDEPRTPYNKPAPIKPRPEPSKPSSMDDDAW